MKQKNPIRNEIVYLWKKEKLPIKGPLRSPRPPTNIGKPDSGAGKGDKLRRGITQNEWGDKWENIFGKSKQKLKESKDAKDKETNKD